MTTKRTKVCFSFYSPSENSDADTCISDKTIGSEKRFASQSIKTPSLAFDVRRKSERTISTRKSEKGKKKRRRERERADSCP